MLLFVCVFIVRMVLVVAVVIEDFEIVGVDPHLSAIVPSCDFNKDTYEQLSEKAKRICTICPPDLVVVSSI